MASYFQKTSVRRFLDFHHPEEVTQCISVVPGQEQSKSVKKKARIEKVEPHVGLGVVSKVTKKRHGCRDAGIFPIKPPKKTRTPLRDAGLFPIRPTKKSRTPVRDPGLFPIRPTKKSKTPLRDAGIFAVKPKRLTALQKPSLIPVPLRLIKQQVSELEVQERQLEDLLATTKDQLERVRKVLQSKRNILASSHYQRTNRRRSKSTGQYSRPVPGTPKVFSPMAGSPNFLFKPVPGPSKRRSTSTGHYSGLVPETPKVYSPMAGLPNAYNPMLGTGRRRSKSTGACSKIVLGTPEVYSYSPMPETPQVFPHLSPALLPPSQNNDPLAMYNNYRRTCPYLQTPQSAIFKKKKTFFSPVIPKEIDMPFSPDVQKQLAMLFN